LLLAEDEYGNTMCHTASKRGNLRLLEVFRSWAKEAQLKPYEYGELLSVMGKYGDIVVRGKHKHLV
jgi:hypothetical protein